jgi:hypothetical protein
MRKRLIYALLAAVALVASLTSNPTVRAEAANATTASPGAAYHYWSYTIKVCPSTPIYGTACNQGFNYWTVVDHVAGWANGTNVVLATASGYPYCTASGYEITVTNCGHHGGGSEIYAVIQWQNCILPFNLGCYSDFATMGFNRNGVFNSFVEDWGDGLP